MLEEGRVLRLTEEPKSRELTLDVHPDDAVGRWLTGLGIGASFAADVLSDSGGGAVGLSFDMAGRAACLLTTEHEAVAGREAAVATISEARSRGELRLFVRRNA